MILDMTMAVVAWAIYALLLFIFGALLWCIATIGWYCLVFVVHHKEIELCLARNPRGERCTRLRGHAGMHYTQAGTFFLERRVKR